MVRVSETTVAKYCDFCPESVETDKENLAKEKQSKRASYICTVCSRDLCDRHVYFLSLPREIEGSCDSDLDFYLHGFRHYDYGDGRICPECALMPLVKVASLILESVKAKVRDWKETKEP